MEEEMKRVLFTMTALICLMGFVAAANADWRVEKSDEYGIGMLVPSDMKMAAKADGKWAGFYGKLGVVEIFGLVNKGTFSKDEEIGEFAIKISGVPANAWKEVDKGQNAAGWKWWRTFQATDGKNLVYALYGHGPKGSYLIFLSTTVADYTANKAAYLKWYNSITLY